MTNPSSFLGKLPLNVPTGVMGILVVMVLPFATAATEILISPNMPLSIAIVPFWMHVVQAVHFSVFPSLSLFILLPQLFVDLNPTKAFFLSSVSGNVAVDKGIPFPGQLEYCLVIFIVLISIQYIVKNSAARISHKSVSWISYPDGMPGNLRKSL